MHLVADDSRQERAELLGRIVKASVAGHGSEGSGEGSLSSGYVEGGAAALSSVNQRGGKHITDLPEEDGVVVVVLRSTKGDVATLGVRRARLLSNKSPHGGGSKGVLVGEADLSLGTDGGQQVLGTGLAAADVAVSALVSMALTVEHEDELKGVQGHSVDGKQGHNSGNNEENGFHNEQ